MNFQELISNKKVQQVVLNGQVIGAIVPYKLALKTDWYSHRNDHAGGVRKQARVAVVRKTGRGYLTACEGNAAKRVKQEHLIASAG